MNSFGRLIICITVYLAIVATKPNANWEWKQETAMIPELDSPMHSAPVMDEKKANQSKSNWKYLLIEMRFRYSMFFQYSPSNYMAIQR